MTLVIMLQLLAGPIGSHMIGRAIHRDEHGQDKLTSSSQASSK